MKTKATVQIVHGCIEVHVYDRLDARCAMELAIKLDRAAWKLALDARDSHLETIPRRPDLKGESHVVGAYPQLEHKPEELPDE